MKFFIMIFEGLFKLLK